MSPPPVPPIAENSRDCPSEPLLIITVSEPLSVTDPLIELIEVTPALVTSPSA